MTTIDVLDPVDGSVIDQVPDLGVEDALAALDTAVKMQADWAATPPRERGEILRRAFELIIERKDEFARTISLEMGKPLAEAAGEVAYGAEFLRWFSEEAVRRLFLASQGRPRTLNQFALQSLIQAAVEGRAQLDAEFVSGQIAAHPLYEAGAV